MSAWGVRSMSAPGKKIERKLPQKPKDVESSPLEGSEIVGYKSQRA